MLPEQFALVGATVRRAETAEHVAARWGVPTYFTTTELVAKQRPDFVVSSVPRAEPEVVTDLVAAGTQGGGGGADRE